MTSQRRNDRYLLSKFRRRFGSFMIQSKVDEGLVDFIVDPLEDSPRGLNSLKSQLETKDR